MTKPISTDGPRPGGQISEQSPKTAEKKSDAEAEEFAAMLEKKEQGKAAERSQRGERRPGGRDRGPGSGWEQGTTGAAADAILRNLQPERGAAASEASPLAPTRPEISDVVQKIADRILVSRNSPAGGSEVRITLKDSVLGGTEIQITREGGQLQVRMLVPDADTRSFLADQQNGLQSALASKLKEDVRVEIRSDAPHEAQDRGEQEGRSRQQRSVTDEWEPE